MYHILLFVVLAIGAVVAFIITKTPKVALDSRVFKQFELIKKTEVSHDTHIFRFALDKPGQTLGLPVGQHIVLRANCTTAGKTEMVTHSYTPISSDDEKGYVDFMIKVYFANTNPRFPNGGRLSQHMFNMKIGDRMQMRGPQGNFTYLGNGAARIQKPGRGPVTEKVDAYAAIAGGTGITPILQIIRAIKKNKEDRTKVFLVYGNQTERDILLRKELDEDMKDDDRFHVWYTIDREASPGWPYDKGYVSEMMFRKHLPVPDKLGDGTVPQNAGLKRVMALMCGPPPMVTMAIKPNLEKIGYTADNMFSF
ncbi:putative NADH-cytochrome b5 reductase [Leptomonas seymouri]|uniref:NADH-cytochrome b5 reductase n=1 Tax=Leptomonas seymouri TaxID=5684 RepID=A0A0N1IAZ4_LEPSE|nr:putative NADH-cytochrome b5 reductase [Leptomonas seymouri]|eukprot:KPI89685.1 putative NADH-cytochrome b5 reductase [Leptomonas seymouri]